MAKTKKHHSVYVIELDEAVLREKKFVLANPERCPGACRHGPQPLMQKAASGLPVARTMPACER